MHPEYMASNCGIIVQYSLYHADTMRPRGLSELRYDTS